MTKILLGCALLGFIGGSVTYLIFLAIRAAWRSFLHLIHGGL